MGSIGIKFPTIPVSVATHPATLPEADISDAIETEAVASAALPALLDLDPAALAGNAIWRDHMALSGTFRTFHSRDLVAKTWQHLSSRAKISDLEVTPRTSTILRFGPKACWLQANFSFKTGGACPATCSGSLGLVPHEGSWKIWLVTTILEQPHGFPNVDDLRPGPVQVNDPSQLDCIVVGGGVAGLGMAGRLKAIGLSYTVIDQHANVGDVWAKSRYDSVKLHTSRDFNQMPGTPRTFGPEDPYYLDGQDIAKGFQKYVKTFGINIMNGTKVVSARFDTAAQTWTVVAQREGETLTLHARHLALATGSMGRNPVIPEYSDQHKYKGDATHAFHWKNAAPWKGKRGIVIGSANTAHDIIKDMVQANFVSVTLVQRSKTWVMPSSTFSALTDPVFNPQTPTEVSDRILMGYPIPVQRLIAMEGIRMCADTEPNPAFFDKLEAQGFKTERYGDLWGLIYDREGGHFFDVGAGQLIADGKVKVKSDALPVAYNETGLTFADGSKIDADVIVFATGYKSDMRDCAKRIVGEEVAENLEDFWQCDAEGEPRGAWRDTGRECSDISRVTVDANKFVQIPRSGTLATDTLLPDSDRDFWR
jgi:cation diffusion facilitator CzcD-associated flavoprotein CzcO